MTIKELVEFQPDIWDNLKTIAHSKRVGSAYCFSGPPGCGKEGLSLAFSALLNCENPNKFHSCNCSSCIRFNSLQHEHLHLVVPLPAFKSESKGELNKKDVVNFHNELEKKRMNPFHKIRIPRATRIILPSIKNLRKSLVLTLTQPGRKTAVIFDAELLGTGSGESANALLKLLEEPPPLTTIILVTDYKNKLFPTIISRCQYIQFSPLSDENIERMLSQNGVSKDRLKWISTLSRGNYFSACKIADRKPEEIKKLFDFISDFMLFNDYQKSIEFASTYAKLSKSDPNEFKFHFYLLQRWLLGVMRLKNGIRDTLNEGKLNTGMTKFLDAFPHTDIRGLNILTESVVAGLNNNANMNLLLTHFIIQLQKELKQTNKP